jgi:hypothetical protein
MKTDVMDYEKPLGEMATMYNVIDIQKYCSTKFTGIVATKETFRIIETLLLPPSKAMSSKLPRRTEPNPVTPVI